MYTKTLEVEKAFISQSKREIELLKEFQPWVNAEDRSEESGIIILSGSDLEQVSQAYGFLVRNLQL